MAEALLYPTLEYLHYEKNPIVTRSSTIDTLRVYKYRPSGNSRHRRADEHSDFAILLSSNSTDSTRCSKLYMGQPCLDFRLDKVHNLMIFKKMHCPNYSLSLEKYSENDILRHMDPEGRPDRGDWKPEDLELSLNNHKGRHELHLFGYVDGWILIIATPGLTMANLMTALTGWELLFGEDTSSVVLKGRGRFSSSNRIKGALVTVWKREYEGGRDIQLLVRASDASKEPQSTTWLSTSREW